MLAIADTSSICFVAYNSSGQVWRVDTSAYENWTNANRSHYAITATSINGGTYEASDISGAAYWQLCGTPLPDGTAPTVYYDGIQLASTTGTGTHALTINCGVPGAIITVVSTIIGQPANGSGVLNVNLNAGSYTITATQNLYYVSTVTAQVDSSGNWQSITGGTGAGTTTLTLSMTQITIPGASSGNKTTVYGNVSGAGNIGVTVTAKQVSASSSSASNADYDATVYTTTIDGSGNWAFTDKFDRNASVQIRGGSAGYVTIKTSNADTTPVPNIPIKA